MKRKFTELLDDFLDVRDEVIEIRKSADRSSDQEYEWFKYKRNELAVARANLDKYVEDLVYLLKVRE